MEAQTTPQRIGRWVLGLVLIGQGINHFIMTDVMVRMMPSALPAHREIVWLSGIAEIALGVQGSRAKYRRSDTVGNDDFDPHLALCCGSAWDRMAR